VPVKAREGMSLLEGKNRECSIISFSFMNVVSTNINYGEITIIFIAYRHLSGRTLILDLNGILSKV
jgi:hypothetical protein